MPLSLAGYGGGVASLSIKINTNLILHLDADNSSSYSGSGTTWTDISGKNHNATLNNGPTYNSDNGIGSIVFDGTNHYAILDSSFQVSTSRTYSFEAWIYKTTNASNNAAMLISGGSGGDKDGIIITSEHYWNTDIDIGSEGGPVNAIYYNGVSQPLNGANTRSTATYNLNEWIHIAVTGITVDNTDGGAHHIAQNNNNSNKFGGRIRSLKVYDGELTASEVQQNFLKSRFIVTDNLIFNLDAGDSNSIARRLSGYWDDISGQSNHGTLTNGITYSSENGGVLVFNGTSDYVITGSDMFNANSNFTFSMWFNSDDFSEQRAFAADVNNSESLFLRYSDGVVGVVNSNTLVLGTFTSSTLSTNTWHNITVTRLSNTYTLYVDGDFKSTVSTSQSFTHSPDTIGANHNIGGGAKNFFDGKIAKVLAYSTALSASEVLQNYNALKGRFGL